VISPVLETGAAVSFHKCLLVRAGSATILGFVLSYRPSKSKITGASKMKSVMFVCILVEFALQGLGQAPMAAPLPPDSAFFPSAGTLSQPDQFQRSVPAGPAAGPLTLSLQDAIARGLKNNLGVLVLDTQTQLARADRIRALAALLPNISGSISETAAQFDFATFGFRLAGVPRVVGPYEYTDARAYASQSLFDWTAIKNHQSTVLSERAATLSVQDGRDLVVQAVASAYFQIAADIARIETSRTQVSMAQALYERAREQHRVGTTPAIDELRAEVQLKTRQLDLITQVNQREKDKLALGRVIGLASGQVFQLSDSAAYIPLEGITLENTLDRAYKSRADYQSAVIQVQAAETALAAAVGERYPTLQVDGNYGALGPRPTQGHETFVATASLRFNVFDAGRSRADIDRARALIKNRKDRLSDLQEQIAVQVRTALLDLQTTAEQVAVARENVSLAEETLVQARTRFTAGVANNIEVVQAQDSVASANSALISAVLFHNLTKVSLARAMGASEATLAQFLSRK
jgi:outer membrane protein TolC